MGDVGLKEIVDRRDKLCVSTVAGPNNCVRQLGWLRPRYGELLIEDV